MKKALLILLIALQLCGFFAFTNLAFTTGFSSSCLKDDLSLDFSQTQYSFIDPSESWFIFKFKATNIGNNVLLTHFDQYCVENPHNPAVQAPQGDVLLAPGESMWFKIVFQSGQLGYDANVEQTINRTFCFQFFDNNHNWDSPNNTFQINQTIQIKVVNASPSQGGTLIQGTTVDENGNPLANVSIDVGSFGTKQPITSGANGQFSIRLCESPVYFLTAQKENYYAKTLEIDGNNIQQSYVVTLTRKQVSQTVTSTLAKQYSGTIGFWRCAATTDESKLLLVNGMENWEDESIKTQSKLYLLNTITGNILWTHDMGWESWSADITDDGKYVAFGTKLEGFQTGPTGFVNYIRLLNGTDGTTIWEKKITTQNFPNSTEGEYYTRAVKFSHDGNYLLVPVHGPYAYLLNREDGSIKWSVWIGSEVREVLFTKDNQYVYIPSSGGYLYKFRVADGSLVWQQWIGCWPYVNGFDLSPNEAYLAVATKAGYFSLINTSDGTVRFTTDLHNGFSTCRFSPDGTKILVGGGLLTMFDLSGNVLWRCYEDFTDLRFSGDGKLIFLANGVVLDDSGTKLYDILPDAGRSTKVGWVNSNATRYIFAIQDTRSLDAVNIIEVYTVSAQESTSLSASPSPTPTTQTSGTSSSSPNSSNSAGSSNSIPEFPASITVAVMLSLVLCIAAFVAKKRSLKDTVSKT
jgi:hypothetical protein